MGMWSRVVGLEDAVHTVHSVHISDDTKDVIRNVKKKKTTTTPATVCCLPAEGGNVSHH